MLQHLSPESWGPTQQLAQSEQTGIAHRNSSLLPVVAEERAMFGFNNYVRKRFTQTLNIR